MTAAHPHDGRPRTAIVGCALNCAEFVETIALNVRAWATRIDLRSILVVEGPSRDDTRARLTAELAGYHLRVIDAVYDTQNLARTERMARLRNLYIDALRPMLSDLDIVIVMDFDDVNATMIDVKDFVHALDFMEKNPAATVFAHQSPLYYDVYALRTLEHPDRDCWKAVSRRSPWMSQAFAVEVFVAAMQRRMGAVTTPVEVASAFGGLAIYRAANLVGAAYAGAEPAVGTVCEHVPLNKRVRANGARLFVLPTLRNVAPPDHLAPAGEALPLLARIESPAAIVSRSLAAMRRVARLALRDRPR